MPFFLPAMLLRHTLFFAADASMRCRHAAVSSIHYRRRARCREFDGRLRFSLIFSADFRRRPPPPRFNDALSRCSAAAAAPTRRAAVIRAMPPPLSLLMLTAVHAAMRSHCAMPPGIFRLFSVFARRCARIAAGERTPFAHDAARRYAIYAVLFRAAYEYRRRHAAATCRRCFAISLF